MFFLIADNSYSSDNLSLQAKRDIKESLASIINYPLEQTLNNSRIAR